MNQTSIPYWQIRGIYQYTSSGNLVSGRIFEVTLRRGYSSRIPRFKDPDKPNYHTYYREMVEDVNIVECLDEERRPVTPDTDLRLWAYLAKLFVRREIHLDPQYPRSRLVKILESQN